jgi:hypothetical protein
MAASRGMKIPDVTCVPEIRPAARVRDKIHISPPGTDFSGKF